MTRNEFKKLKEGDIVITNGRCRNNSGIVCKVTHICVCDDCVWLKPIGTKQFNSDNGWCRPEWNEVSYRAINFIKDEDSA